MMQMLEGIATTLWILLAIYCFYHIHKWNNKFSELYEQFKRDMEETE